MCTAYTVKEVASFFEMAVERLRVHHQRVEAAVLQFFLVADVVRKRQVEFDRQYSSRFNVFDYISPNENMLSDIIGDLLEPEGSHGQGYEFLDLFLRRFAGKKYMGGPFLLKREHHTSCIDDKDKRKRRIDLIFKDGNFWYGIENKPWAADQKDQVTDYAEELSNRAGEEFLLLYISASGSYPDCDQGNLDKLIEAGKVGVFGYRDISEWLSECHSICQSARLRFFIQDFIIYINKEVAK